MITVVSFREVDGRTPFRDWFHDLPLEAKIQCRARLQLLSDQGHLLRRPAADYLRDGVYELRAKARRLQYRMLYFFHGREAVVISHGIVKQEAVMPPIEIEHAIRRKAAYARNPVRHTDVMKEPP